MSRFYNLAFSSLFILLLAFNANSKETPFVQGDILIEMLPGKDVKKVVSDFAVLYGKQTGLRITQEITVIREVYLLSYDYKDFDQFRVLEEFRKHPDVWHAQFNHLIEERAIPNDPLFGNQWHHNNIQSQLAWDISTGGQTANGDQIVICVIEPGGANYNHADLIGNHWVNTGEIPGNGIDDDGNGYVDDYNGWNAAANNGTIPSGNHGCAVSGMLGAVGNNNSGGAGVNWNVKIMQVNLGSATTANVLAAYGYPFTMRNLYNTTNGAQGAFVVATNASWGIDNANPNNYPIWCGYYDTLGSVGILNCGATTNNNVNVDINGDMPTACPSPYMIGVTATNSSDVRTFSGYGVNTIDLAAPGASVLLPSGTAAGSTSYSTTSGTSFASPCVAGVIGLMYSAPCSGLATMAIQNPQQAADLVRQWLLDGVDLIPNLANEVITGGRVNAKKSMDLVLANCPSSEPCAGTPNPGATLTSNAAPCSGEIFTLSLQNFTQGSGVSYQWQSSPNGSTWTNFGLGGTTQPASITSSTHFRCIVTCTASGSSANSVPIVISPSGTPCQCLNYCTAGATATVDEKIGNVSFNTINNSSSSTAGYEDFTNLSTTVVQGSTYPLSVTITNPFSNDELRAWIDWNQNGVFDAGEQIMQIVTGAAGPHTVNVTVPANATLGSTRLRVRLHWLTQGANATPCGTSTYGQVEDYCVQVISSGPVPGCINPNACNFNPGATVDDGSCTFPGCTNPAASNYDPTAGCDDGSCVGVPCTVVPPTCVVVGSAAYNQVVNADAFCCDTAWDALCQNAYDSLSNTCIGGCTDPAANNYNPNAGFDDGTCDYSTCVNHTLTITTDCWGNETGWSLIGSGGNTIASVAPGTLGNLQTYTWNFCLSDGCYTFNITDTYGDGMNGSIWTGCDNDGNYFITNNQTGQTAVQMTVVNFGTGTSHDFCVASDCYEPVVRALAPSSVAGLYNYTTATTSGWGGTIGQPSVSGTAVWVNDGSGSPTLGCGPLTNGAQLNGNVAVALRGTCNFSQKALNAQNAGASALIIINNVAGAPIAMGPGAGAENVTIPVVMISQADGNALTSFINAGTLQMFIGNDCEPQVVEGCTNPAACNFNPDATSDNGSCTFPGCTDPAACNYSGSAGCDDGSCTFPGCTDMNACNFNPGAGCDDGSCTQPGCTNPLACNYNASAGCDNGSCVIPPSNDICTGAIALNVNGGFTATTNANSCLNAPNPTCGGGTQIQDIWYSFVYTGGNIAVTATGGTIGSKRVAVFSSCGGTQIGCANGTTATLSLTCPNLVSGQTYLIQAGGNQGNTGTFNIQVTSSTIAGCTDPAASNYDPCATNNTGCIYPGCTDSTACNFNPQANQNDGSCIYPGCTDSGACNFNAAAGCDNGSCVFPGCTDPTACNFDSTAGCDDGSCDYSCGGTCVGDLNNDGVVDFSDLTILLSNFGCVGVCVGDFNGDGLVNFPDLTILLANFGLVCP